MAIRHMPRNTAESAHRAGRAWVIPVSVGGGVVRGWRVAAAAPAFPESAVGIGTGVGVSARVGAAVGSPEGMGEGVGVDVGSGVGVGVGVGSGVGSGVGTAGIVTTKPMPSRRLP